MDAYDYIDGMPQLLRRLRAAGFDVHACSNYPVWYRLIESKLQLSRYLDWTFISCEGAMKVSLHRGCRLGRRRFSSARSSERCCRTSCARAYGRVLAGMRACVHAGRNAGR